MLSQSTYFLGDADRIKQVLLCLLGNAIKFTEHGSISVALKTCEKGRLIFAVTDTGCGIHPDHHEKIFERFSQLDGSRTRKHGGTGLGLSIAKDLVELMGGEIGVRSTPENGATFIFVLPLPHANHETGAMEATQREHCKLQHSA